MEEIQIDTFSVHGLVIRTNNEAEMNPETGKIPAHVDKVDSNLTIDYPSGARLYSVYHNYESDVNCNYDFLMGSTQVSSSKIPLSSVEIMAGKYLKFESEGEFPQAVISAWQSIWAYFSAENCPHQRAYSTDFEHYESENKVSVYIALK